MLCHLHIENYALIRQSDIDFDSGFVVITGETGAGKSILLGALALLLGQRADSKTLFNPEKKCIVEAQFDLHALQLRHLFEDNDVDYSDDGMVIIRRELLPGGKSRAFVNDTPVAVTFLKQLGSAIIDIHSQHATLLLADSDFQISLLDCLSDNRSLLTDYQQSYNQYSDLKRQLERLTVEEQQQRKDYDYNKFLFDELEQARLTEGEQETLEQESTLLSNAEEIKQTLSQVAQCCDGEEDSALQRLNYCQSMLHKISGCHPDIQALHDRLNSTLIELNDMLSTVEQLNESITYSPERQQQVDERLDLIYRLQKKHNVDSVGRLLELQEQLDQQLSSVHSMDQRIKQVMEAVDKAYVNVRRQAAQLTATRKKAATELEQQMAPLFNDLGMGDATIKAQIASSDHYGPRGNDSVCLLFNANKGGTLQPLSKVASGGELSRLMLAVKSLTARAALLPTIIFDEIDSGISGDISVKVARIMQRMSQNMQVIAITHLPQIAARARQHYKVYKDTNTEQTESNIRLLTDKERQHELAVMLSAEPPTTAALQTAAELMKM